MLTSEELLELAWCAGFFDGNRHPHQSVLRWSRAAQAEMTLQKAKSTLAALTYYKEELDG